MIQLSLHARTSPVPRPVLAWRGRRPVPPPVRRSRILYCDAVNDDRTDPTGTGTIRRRFEREVLRRLRRVRAAIRREVVTRDVLGLRDPLPNSVGYNEFDLWLRRLLRRELIGMDAPSPDGWWRRFIELGYAKGRGDAAARIERLTTDAPKLIAGFGPTPKARVDDLATRTYMDLDKLSEAARSRVAEILAEGLAEGLSADDIAAELVGAIDGMAASRARTIARTETISAHAEGALDEYREAGIDGVSTLAEFTTAGDDQVCPECQELEGQVFSLAEAEGMIPVHPNCRCAWLPVV